MDSPAPEDRGRTTAGGASEAGSASEPIERQLRHRALAARTVAVSFRAAMDSARRHLQVTDAERHEIKERWRSWALDTLQGYSRDLDELVARQPIHGDGASEALARCREELERSLEIVRTTEGD